MSELRDVEAIRNGIAREVYARSPRRPNAYRCADDIIAKFVEPLLSALAAETRHRRNADEHVRQLQAGLLAAPYPSDLADVESRAERAEQQLADRDAKLAAALALHRENPGKIKVCVHCHGSWPCDTTAALSSLSVPTSPTPTKENDMTEQCVDARTDAADAYGDAVAALAEVTGGAPLSTTIGWMIRARMLIVNPVPPTTTEITKNWPVPTSPQTEEQR